MKIAWLMPTGYGFFRDMLPFLEREFEVSVDTVDADLVVACMLPQTPQHLDLLEGTDRLLVLWHWDLYSFVDLEEPRWARFLRLLPRAADVWSCSYETARQLKEQVGIDSCMMPAWIHPEVFQCPADLSQNGRPYAMYAATSNSIGKRSSWAEEVCYREGIELRLRTGQRMPRREYLRELAGCRVYLMTAFEESNGTVPAMEAAAMGKPLVMADLPSSREVFGRWPWYFRSWDFADLRRQLRAAWDHPGDEPSGLRDRMLIHYSLPMVACKIVRRIREVALHRGVEVRHGRTAAAT